MRQKYVTSLRHHNRNNGLSAKVANTFNEAAYFCFKKIKYVSRIIVFNSKP